ncbi:MAG: hypothetical protein QOK05_1204 [Chloroflexota bacterium]|nr:hypothetical protein [Chloroflexota bacterium]
MTDQLDRLCEDARITGRQLAPDVGPALEAVMRRSALRRGQTRARRRVAIPSLVVLVLAALAAVPGMALTSHVGAGPVPPLAAAANARPAAAGVLVQPAMAVVPPRPGRGSTQPLLLNVPGQGQAPGGSRVCSPGQLSLEIAFDRAVYAPGDAVAVTLVTRNSSAATCTLPTDPCLSSITISSRSGAVMYASGADPRWICAPARSQVVLVPAGIAELTFTWAPPGCTGAVGCTEGSSPGTYVVGANWTGAPSDADAGAAPFSLVALPRHLVVGAGIQS